MIIALFVSSAFATDPDPGSVIPDRHNTGLFGRPAVTIDEKDCRTEIVGQFIATGQIDDVVLADAKARRICALAAGELDILKAKAKVIESRAVSDTIVAAGASMAIANGGSIVYRSSPEGETEIVGGDAATMGELAKGLVAMGPMQYPSWYAAGYGDPRLDASAAFAAQSYAGFNASQRSSEVWRSQAASATASKTATEAELAQAKAAATAAKREASALRTERDALASDLAETIAP